MDFLKREKEKEKEKIEIKRDCFAYDERRNNCKALTDLYCEFEKCNFYKTKRCMGDDYEW